MTIDRESHFARHIMEGTMRVLNTDMAFRQWIKQLPVGEMTRLSVLLLNEYKRQVRDVESYTLDGKFNDNER